MNKTKACPTVSVILMFLVLAPILVQPVKASSNLWSETWHSGIYEDYPGYPQNISTTKIIYSNGSPPLWWIKTALVVSVYEYEYEPWLGEIDAVYFRVVLYFDSFASEELPTPNPVAAQHITFLIDKDSSGSNLGDQAINVQQEDPALYPGVSQGRGLDQYDRTDSVYSNRLWWALDSLGHSVALFSEPVGIAEALIYGGASYAPDNRDYDNADWDETQATIWWFNPGYDFRKENPIRQYAFNTIRWAQCHDVNPDAYYGIKVRAIVDLPMPNPFGVDYIETSSVYLKIHRSGGGGGEPCPILSVYDGTEYVEEGLLDIHNPDCMDEVTSRVLTVTPEAVEHRYLMRLTEHPQTDSHIDQVQLFATIKDGTEINLPLVSAVHSADGNVLLELLLSDDIRADTLGADHNNGTSEYIDLKFVAPEGLEIEEFTFTIEGYNPEFK